jgi:hypothetical protein
VIGYPTGGDNTSITSGVVSRVEVTLYVHAASHLMAIQIDAAINPGKNGDELSCTIQQMCSQHPLVLGDGTIARQLVLHAGGQIEGTSYAYRRTALQLRPQIAH